MCTHSGELSRTADCRLWRWGPSCCRCPRRPEYHRQLPSSGYWTLQITHSSSVHKEGLILPRSAGYATLFFPHPAVGKFRRYVDGSKGDEHHSTPRCSDCCSNSGSRPGGHPATRSMRGLRGWGLRRLHRSVRNNPTMLEPHRKGPRLPWLNNTPH